MCIFCRKYSANESDEKLASALLYCMQNGEMKEYRNLMNFCNFINVNEPINPKKVKFKRMIATEGVKKVLKLWQNQSYKCNNKYLTKGIELLKSKI